MKKIYPLLLIIIPFTLQAQSGKKKEYTDSASYYQSALAKMWRIHMDSLYNSEAYKELKRNYDNQVKKSNDYIGYVIFADVVGSDVRDFNAQLADDGFPPLESVSGRFGFGTSTRVNRFLVDLYFVTIGLNNSTTKGDEKITAKFTSAFQVDLGYDLLKSKIFSLYPYGGIALRFSSLRYEKPGQFNPDYSRLIDMRSDENKISVESVRIGYQLGIGLDCTLLSSKDDFGKTILFIKGGINKPFWKDAYRVHTELPKYQPNIKHGDYIISFGLKFAIKG